MYSEKEYASNWMTLKPCAQTPNVAPVKLQIRKDTMAIRPEYRPVGILLYYACIQRADNFILARVANRRGPEQILLGSAELCWYCCSAGSWVTFVERRPPRLGGSNFWTRN